MVVVFLCAAAAASPSKHYSSFSFDPTTAPHWRWFRFTIFLTTFLESCPNHRRRHQRDVDVVVVEKKRRNTQSLVKHFFPFVRPCTKSTYRQEAHGCRKFLPGTKSTQNCT